MINPAQEILDQRNELDMSIDTLEDELGQARTTRDSVYETQRRMSGLVLDPVELSDVREAEYEADAMAEHAGEIVSILEGTLQKARDMLADLPDEVPCEECGAVFPADEDADPLQDDLHEAWCPLGDGEE